MVEVVEAGRHLDDFIRFPLDLYRGDPCYVPQLIRDQREHFSARNPFMSEAKVCFLIARKGGRAAGRIAAFVNPAHNRFHRDLTGFFGFFDSVDDPDVAATLFGRAASFLGAEGMSVMRGPMNFSTNEECGLLVEGFGEPPKIMMPYNFPYYERLITGCGLSKARDLYAYIYKTADRLPEKVLRVAAIAEKRGITVRPIDMKRFEQEMGIFREVYHSAWEKNWGFVPMSDAELAYASARLKQIVLPELTMVAEEDGMPVGFMGLVPDANMVLRHMGGSMNPLSLIKALYHSRRISELRLLLLGIKREFRNRGVEALLLREGYAAVRRGNYRRIEFSWILEDNIPIQNIIEMIGGRAYKTYRIYEKSV